MAESPFTIEVYSKAFTRQGWIGAPVSLDASIRHNALSTLSLTVDADHPRVEDLLAGGARLVVQYRGRHLLSGPIRSYSGEGPAGAATVTVTVEDDFRLLHRLLMWPNPRGSLSQQNVEYFTIRDTVTRGSRYAVTEQAARLGIPVTAGGTSEGPTVTLTGRMDPLADKIIPALDAAGYGIRVRQQGAGFLVETYKPTRRPHVLAEDSGAVVDWKWDRAAPAVTRVVVGGQGEGTARTFVGVTDAALEAAYADKIEVFRDARDEETSAVLSERGSETLTEGAPTSGLSITLAESGPFRYGETFEVGDTITTRIAPGAEIVDTLREVTIKWSASDGLILTPAIGERTDDPSRTTALAISSIARGLRKLLRR